jgi:hypothetical protein
MNTTQKWFLALALAGCTQTGTGEPVPIPTEPPEDGTEQPAPVVDSPQAPRAEDGTQPAWPAAPPLGEVLVVPNRDSAVLVLPEVANARDYRVFRVPSGAGVRELNGGEQVDGTTVHCAGYRQHNDAFTGTRELMRVVEVTNLAGPTTLVVEALAAPCPYPGALAPVHQDVRVTIDEVPVEDRVTFSLFTEAEIRARFGSLVINGHGRGTSLGAPGPTTPPRVLARTTVRVTPLGTAQPRTATFFDDFDGASGALEPSGTADSKGRAYAAGRRLSNSKWDFFVYNDHQRTAQLSQERGLLHVTLPDWEQDVFATVVGVPRVPVPLSSSAYLHLTFEVPSNATARRYWWVGLCGPERAGEAFDAERHFTGHLVQTSFFYEPDGLNVSTDGWNCLQFFPRDGSPFELGPSKTRSESDVRVMVNRADAGVRESVVNVSPPQYPSYAAKPSWFRMQDASGALGAGLLDDQLHVGVRTRFDAYVRRDRLILYVNGQQRLCNDFPKTPLTMAEGAVAFGQVLYHSAAERLEFSRGYNDRTAQRYYLENAPYVDERDWDNVGFEVEVDAPPGFDPGPCYRAP